MAVVVVNRLFFATNRDTVRSFLMSKQNTDHEQVSISLNSIKPMPEQLNVQLDSDGLHLSKLNGRLPELDEETQSMIRKHDLISGDAFKDNSEIKDTIKQADRLDKNTQLIANYNQLGFFSYYDWRLAHWGTIEDVVSVDSDTTSIESELIEFETVWMPPVEALQILSNTFPSVKFRLQYRLKNNESWIKKQFYPFPPFGY